VASARVKKPRTLPRASIRDRRTLEIRQVLPLPKEPGETAHYELAMYFFFPRSFGVGPDTYDHARFYRDCHGYLRLTSTEATLSALHDMSAPHNPAAILRRELAELTAPEAPDGETLESLAQMVGAEVAEAAEREAKHLRRSLPTIKPAMAEHMLETLCADTLSTLGTIRRLRAKALAYRAVAPKGLLDSLAFAEEYGCAVVEEELAGIARAIEETGALYDGKGTAARMRLTLASTLAEVNARRRDQGFAVPWGKSPEFFSYRIGLLKKEVQRALYLDTRTLKRDPLIVNSVAMVAAGLAATWATLAQLPLWTGAWQTKQGGYFLAAAVGAYILKDRIKEWTRHSLARRLIRWDHDRKIAGNALTRVGLGGFTGRSRERVFWVKDGELPDDVARLRKKNRTVRGVEPELESVLAYERSFEVRQDPLDTVPPSLGIQELHRYSLNDVLRRLDDPLDHINFYDSDTGRFRSQELPKVYHLNVVVVATDVTTGAQHLERLRVVVNRMGILRIDEVASARSERELGGKRRAA